MISRDKSREHTLEFLLDFDGRTHWYEDGCHIRFAIKRVEPTPERPHGLRYSLTLHDADGARLVGFDNAHIVTTRRGRYSAAPETADHWHRTGSDAGRPYEFKDAETLIEDFFSEIERVLKERGISFAVVAVDETRRK